MKAVIYARVSTIEQTLDSQVKLCEEYVLQQGGSILKIYKDHGYGGLNDDRPALIELMKDASNEDFDTLVVSASDRLFRNNLKLEEFKNGLRQLNIKLDVVN